MPDYKNVAYETVDDGTIARIMLDRPESRNAQNRGLLVELNDAFLRAEADDTVRVVILGGAGAMFSSGHDMGSKEAIAERSPGPDQHPTFQTNGGTRKGAESRMLQEWHYFFENTKRWRNLRKITIAQVHGTVYAAGLMLMWACDLIVAADDARFSDVVGTRLGMCGVEYFAHPWEFGPRKTKELMLTGDAIDAEEAHQLGMVSKIFPADDLADRTLKFARRIAALPTMTALLIKESVNQSVDNMGFQNALTACFTLHELNHAHWAEVHENGRPVAAVEDGIANWKDAPPVVLATKDEVRGRSLTVPGILEGVRVLEVAQWWFVPAAAAALADWGADVIKVEHPEHGDPMRGLRTGGGTLGGGARSFMFEQPNRGKRSIGIDIKTDAGRELLYKLAAESDVFITSILPDARRRLGIDLDDLRRVNPRIIYARGHGQGADGPDSEKGGYDAASFWARGGIGNALTPPNAAHPAGQRAAFGDSIGAITLAGGVAAALFGREHTGEPSVVDVSLLGTAAWVLAPDTIIARQLGTGGMPQMSRSVSANPIVNSYQTKDGRWIMLVMMESDRFWPELCVHLDRPELVVDERFADAGARAENAAECVAILGEIFGSATLAEWRERLANIEGVWAAMQTAGELHDDPQVVANNYITYLTDENGEQPLVRAPVQFDSERPDLEFAPMQGEHTDAVLTEAGVDAAEIASLREQGVIG